MGLASTIQVRVIAANQVEASSLTSLPETRPQMTLVEKEDYDMQQAMSQSMTEGQIAGQENGVITGKDPQFGPATREHYDTQKWTMTLPRTFAQEIIANPDPPDRKRAPGSPAFFKPSLGADRLPALIKILHSIPMGREALLCRGHTLPDYGYNGEWWDGVPIDIRKMKVVNRAQEDMVASPDEIIYETQRLIAFLDLTERAYGSVDALAQLPSLKGHPGDLLPGLYLSTWTAAASDANVDHSLATVFTTKSATTDSEDREVESHLHHLFDISIPETGMEPVRTLYDIMDGQFWGDDLELNAEYHYLKEAGDILCIQLSCQNEKASCTGVKVPSILYLDRYFASSKEHVGAMLAAKRTVKQDIEALDDATNRILKYSPLASQQTFDAPSLIARVVKHFQTADIRRDGSVSNEDAQAVDELKALAERVSTKLASE